METTHTYEGLNVGETFTFANCLIQTNGMMGMTSKHCKEVEIEVAPYAQHRKALNVVYLEKGKRNKRGFWVCGDCAMLLVVPAVPAGAPADPFKPAVTSNGCSVREMRYASCDDRFESDHTAQLDAAGVTPMFYLNPQTLVEMPTIAVIVDLTDAGWETKEVPISELATIAEITGRFESRSVRKELQGQPVLSGYGAPMWGGEGRIRYEGSAASAILGGD